MSESLPWSYSAYWRRDTSAGPVGIDITCPKQVVMEIFFIRGEIVTDTPNKWYLYHTFSSSPTVYYYYNTVDKDLVVFPCKDYLEGFEKPLTEKIILFPNDKLTFGLSNANINQRIIIDVRARLSYNSIPTVAAMGGNQTRLNEYINAIVGVA